MARGTYKAAMKTKAVKKPVKKGAVMSRKTFSGGGGAAPKPGRV
jgi:hypothetical protein